jgi:hypothetical protein
MCGWALSLLSGCHQSTERDRAVPVDASLSYDGGSLADANNGLDAGIRDGAIPPVRDAANLDDARDAGFDAATDGSSSEAGFDAGSEDAAARLDATPCVVTLDDVDSDGDGVVDRCDVCPTVSDRRQLDVDGDGRGWACDSFEILGLPPRIEPHLLYREGTFAAAAEDEIITVSATGVLVAGRCDGTDPALLHCEGRPSIHSITGSTVVFSGGVAGRNVFLRVDEEHVDRPFDIAALSTDFAIVSDGLVWVQDGHLFMARRREGPRDLGAVPPGTVVAGGTRASVLLGTGALYVVDSGTLVPVMRGSEPFVPFRAAGAWPGSAFFWDADTLRSYRVSGTTAVQELDLEYPRARWTCPVVHNESSRIGHSMVITQGCATGALTSVVITDPSRTTAVISRRTDTSAFVRWTEQGAIVEWSTSAGQTYEYVDVTTGALTPLSSTPILGVHATWRERFAVFGMSPAGETRLILSDGPTVIMNVTTAETGGELEVAVGAELVVTRQGSVVRAWSPAVPESVVIEASAADMFASTHGRSVLVDVRSATGVVTRAIRVERDHFVITELPSIEGHSVARLRDYNGSPEGWVQASPWSASSRLVRLEPDVTGNLTIAEELPGWVAESRLERAGVLLVSLVHGRSMVLARLGRSLDVLWRGRGVSLHSVGVEWTYPVLDDGAQLHICSVREPSRIACWSLPSGTVVNTYMTRPADDPDPTFAWLAWDRMGRAALARTVGPPDRMSLP